MKYTNILSPALVVVAAGMFSVLAGPSTALAASGGDSAAISGTAAVSEVEAAAAQKVWDYVRTHDAGVGLPLDASAETHAANAQLALEYWAGYPIEAAGAQYGCDVRMASNAIEFVPDVGANLHTVTFTAAGDCDVAVNPETRVRVEALPVEDREAAAAFMHRDVEGTVAAPHGAP